MKLGFFTLPSYIYEEGEYVENENASLSKLERVRRERNLDYIEFFSEHFESFDELERKPKSLKFCHLSFMDTPIYHKENLEIAVDFFEKQIQKFKKDFDIFDLHPPNPWIFIPDEIYRERLGDFTREMDRLLKKYDIKLRLENEMHKKADMKVIMKNSDNLGLTFDIGHAYMVNKTKDGCHPLEFFDSVYERVENIHIMDSRRSAKYHHDHKALGEGNLAIKSFLKKIRKKKYEGNLTLEVLSLEDIKKSTDYLRDLNFI